MFRLTLIFGATVFAGCSVALLNAQENDLQFDLSPRNWVSVTGEFSVSAKLVDYANRNLTLEKADQTTIQVSCDLLSAADKRYLANQLHLAKSKREKKVVVNSAAGNNDVETNHAEKVNEPQPNAKRLNAFANIKPKPMYGIDWYSRDEAIQLANSMDNPRPIMWLRVLGDLSGFM